MILTLHKLASPIIFYQSCRYVTEDIFKQLVKQQYPLPATSMEARSLPLPDYHAVQYAAGYVVRHLCLALYPRAERGNKPAWGEANLHQHLERGSHQLKEELVVCLEKNFVQRSENIDKKRTTLTHHLAAF